MWFILETRTGRHPFSLNPCLDYGKMHYTICHALRKVSMKFIKEKLSLLYPLFLLLFYFYIRPQFRPLAQYVSNSLASANSYYWTLFGMETLYAAFTGFLVYRFSKKAQFSWRKNQLQSLLEAVFAACLVYWLDYFISGFVQGRAAVLSLFPREISPTGVVILVAMMVIVRPVTEELIFRGALVNAYFKGWPIYAEVWLPALIYSGLHFLHSPFSLGAFIIYLLPSLIFGTLYYRSKALLSPILGHILLNLYYTLPLLLSVFQ